MAASGFVKGREGEDYKGRVTLFVVFSSMVAAMGGLIFRYDIGISGLSLSILSLF